MSHIINNRDDLYKIDYFFKKLNFDDFSEEDISLFLETFLPRSEDNELLVDYMVSKQKHGGLGSFIPSANLVVIYFDEMCNYIKKITKNLDLSFNNYDHISYLKSMIIFFLAHEIEHGYQYLIGGNKMDCSYNVVSSLYKGIFDAVGIDDLDSISKKIKNNLIVLSYKLHYSDIVLERNADIDASLLLLNYASFSNNDYLSTAFNQYINYCNCNGYKENNMGSFYYTYKKFLLKDKFKQIYREEDISFKEKVRYGLPLTEEERNKVLTFGKK